MSLEHRTVTVSSPDPRENPEAAAFFRAVRQGFVGAAPSPLQLRRMVTDAHRDAWRLRSVRDTEAPAYALDEPVATFLTYDTTLNVGPEMPVTAITDVTVRATHRRRGLLRQMMTAELDAAKRRGHALACLTVTEGAIYGRFGFGPTTHVHTVEVDTSHGFAMRHEPRGRAYAVDRETGARLGAELFDRCHARRFGSMGRISSYHLFMAGEVDHRTGDPDPKRRIAVHVDDAGEVDGWVAYAAEGETRGTLRVHELLALTPDAYLALWQLLASIDLVTTVVWSSAPADDVLPWALRDPRGYRITAREDLLWTRVLDAPALLGGRGYGDATGRLVLAVEDDLGHAAGTWELDVAQGHAEVRPTGAEPQVACTAEELGPLVLGGASARQLVAADRIRADDAAIRAADALFGSLGTPWTSTRF